MKLSVDEMISVILTDESAQILDDKYRRTHAHEWIDRLYSADKNFFDVIYQVFQQKINESVFPITYIGDSRKVSYSSREMIESAVDFAGEVLGDWAKERVLNLLLDDHTKLSVRETSPIRGKNFLGVVNGTTNVHVQPTDNISGWIAVVHEIVGHGLSQRAQEQKQLKIDSLGEIEAMFVERLFLDYLLQKRELSQDEYKVEVGRMYANCTTHVDFIRQERDICEVIKLPFTKEKLAEAIETFKGSKNFVPLVKHLYDQVHGKDNAYYSYRYVEGLIVTTLFYEDYKKDPAQTIARYREYMQKSSDYKDERKAFRDLLGDEYDTKIKTLLSTGAKVKENK